MAPPCKTLPTGRLCVHWEKRGGRAWQWLFFRALTAEKRPLKDQESQVGGEMTNRWWYERKHFIIHMYESGNQPTFWEGSVLSCLMIILIKLPYLVYRWDRKVWQKKAVSCAIPCSYFVCVCPLQAGESVWLWKSPALILALVWKEGWAPAQETNPSLYKKYSVVRPLFLIFIFNHI